MAEADWFKDIDNEKVWCSTPRNRLFTSGSAIMNEFSEISVRQEDENALKVNTLVVWNSINISIDSDLKIESDKINEQDMNFEKPAILQNNLVDDIFDQPVKNWDLSNRQDVVNKASLRHMKRFYTNIFKQK